jgi:hypothetical protein
MATSHDGEDADLPESVTSAMREFRADMDRSLELATRALSEEELRRLGGADLVERVVMRLAHVTQDARADHVDDLPAGPRGVLAIAIVEGKASNSGLGSVLEGPDTSLLPVARAGYVLVGLLEKAHVIDAVIQMFREGVEDESAADTRGAQLGDSSPALASYIRSHLGEFLV